MAATTIFLFTNGFGYHGCRPHRAGNELSYYPGEVNLRIADVVIINKMTLPVRRVLKQCGEVSRRSIPAPVIDAASPIRVTAGNHPQ
jgi:predicted GTPase